MNTRAKDPREDAHAHRNASTIRLTLAGLILLCVCLVTTTAALTHTLDSHKSPAGEGPVAAPAKATQTKSTGESSPWGDLITLDMEIEQPEEYVSFETTATTVPTWVFSDVTLAQVRTLMGSCGMTTSQISMALADGKVEDTPQATIVRPGDDVVLSLSPEVRSKLYTALAQWPANHHMEQPYHLPGLDFELLFAKSKVEPAAIEMVKKLAYVREGNRYFSDLELVTRMIGSEEGRMRLLKALTYQTAVLARIRVGPDSDIDKILGYWGTAPGVRIKDLRPLLESIKKIPEGGSISLLYFLPPFARERLYTFPLPTKPGDTKMDCHWSTLNFFNEHPDDRFQDTTYASNYIRDNFYQIGKPTMCGDVVFLLNSKGEVIHSAVYIADDLVFTKNGVNFGQPWILMRMKDLLAVYTFSSEPRAMYYRRKEE